MARIKVTSGYIVLPNGIKLGFGTWALNKLEDAVETIEKYGFVTHAGLTFTAKVLVGGGLLKRKRNPLLDARLIDGKYKIGQIEIPKEDTGGARSQYAYTLTPLGREVYKIIIAKRWQDNG